MVASTWGEGGLLRELGGTFLLCWRTGGTLEGRDFRGLCSARPYINRYIHPWRCIWNDILHPFQGFFSCSHWCSFLDFSLFFVAHADNCASLCLHTWCEHSWVYNPVCTEYFTVYGHCPSHLILPISPLMPLGKLYYACWTTIEAKSLRRQVADPKGLGTRPSHSSSGFFLLIFQAACHDHM